jgi:hypothetical protein
MLKLSAKASTALCSSEKAGTRQTARHRFRGEVTSLTLQRKTGGGTSENKIRTSASLGLVLGCLCELHVQCIQCGTVQENNVMRQSRYRFAQHSTAQRVGCRYVEYRIKRIATEKSRCLIGPQRGEKRREKKKRADRA